jgi:XTP/dITP diphosphohydrolase
MTEPSRSVSPASGSEAAARTGEHLLDLVAVMDRLRSPGGCPWDARQTHESLVEYLIEEAYETVETIEGSDRDGLREELGDLLLQVVFHARIAAEDPDDPWTIDDVADGIVTKLIARHPHVFGEATAETAEQVEANWHALKAKEKGRESVTDGIPSALPALVHAGKVISRSAALGDRLPALTAREAAEEAMSGVADEEAFGDLLVALVAIGRERGFDAESAARVAARRRIAEIRAVEGLA